MLSENSKGGWTQLVSVQSKIEIEGDLSLVSLSRRLDEANVNKEILKSVLEKIQEDLVNDQNL